MTLPERPDTDQAGRTKKNSILPVFLVSLVLGAGIAGAWMFFSPSPPSPVATIQQTPNQPSSTAPSAEIPLPPSPLPVQKESLLSPAQLSPTAQAGGEQIPNEESSAVATENPEPAAPVPAVLTPRQLQCEQLAVRLHTFFTHLDQKEYIQKFELGAPAQDYFLALATKLLNTPPVVSRESDDLYTILKNMAHFFRVIGGKNILVIKGILDRERETIEDVAADVFSWTTGGEECSNEKFSFHAPLDKLYEYAGFFLNSMGGRSYLFRRDSRSRLLINYYAILLVDRANMEGINRHGIDIKPLLPVTISEIEGSNQLIYKEKYLDKLYALIEKYQ